MAISFVGAVSTSATTATTVTPAIPTGATTNDLHLLVIANPVTAVTYTTPTGYAILDTGTADTNMSAIAYWRILQAGDTAKAINFTSSRYAVMSAAFRGTDLTNPFSTHNVTNLSTGTAGTTTAVTPAAATDWAVAFFTDAELATGTAQTQTTPTGYTAAAMQSGTNPALQGSTTVRETLVGLFYKALSSTASENPSTTLASSSAHRNFLMTLQQPVSAAAAGRVQHMSRFR